MSSPSEYSGSESSSSSSSSSSRPMTLSEFNPFATHHFTSCTSSTHASDRPNPAYGYPYGPNNGTFNAPQSSRTNPTSYNTSSIVAPTPTLPSRQPAQTQRGPIFTTFRKETASPDLSDILKSNNKASYSQSSKSSTTSTSSKPTAAPVPIVASRKY
ncbi:hypothetical protein BJ165DRAFT_1439735 [Panaeolus papilionaceus]|nr:hypothetical protein BJ165DRAFT_1439735 [Panaeolus papilionaceus]